MITTKQNGTQYNKLNKDIISFHIENRWIIANVNRQLNFEECIIDKATGLSFNKYIDDITQEEIQAGTQAVKEYCLSNNELKLLKQYLPLVLQDDELLKDLKAIKLIEINQAYENAIKQVQREHIPVTEMLSFETQERESLAYKNSDYTDDSLCPTMKVISTARGIDLRELCDKCLLKATFYRQAGGVLIGKRQGLQDRIEQVASIEDLEQISWN